MPASQSNALLNSYRQQGVPGNYPRMTTQGGIGYLFQERGNAYGPSQQAYTHWKKSGVPTSDTMQSTAMGMSTHRGDTAGDALNFSAPAKDPAPNYARAPAGKPAAPRANPITWLGGEPEEPYVQRKPASIAIPPPEPQPQQHTLAPSSQPLSPQQMHETWAHLLRTRQAPSQLSSAQCLIDMPPEYSTEAPPPRPALDSQSMLTIGLHPQNGGRQVRRSSAFTSDFRDPFQ